LMNVIRKLRGGDRKFVATFVIIVSAFITSTRYHLLPILSFVLVLASNTNLA
jgi:hypothetical protein